MQPLLEHFATPGPMTTIAPAMVAALPDDAAEICRIATGLIAHEHLMWLYESEVPDERRPDLQLRQAQEILDVVMSLDDSPLTEVRPVQRRAIGNCRQYSTVTAALLRSKGIPARARCGFGMYFDPAKGVDHWVVDRWDEAQQRWVRVDTQIDSQQREVFNLQFDPADLPADVFLPAGEAWQKCRRGEADPDTFGILDMWGLWFVQGNVMRDLAAQLKIETLPWDVWGVMDDDLGEQGEAGLATNDRAALLAEGDDLAASAEFYQSTSGWSVPGDWLSS